MNFCRSSGILLHITSLPGPCSSGDLGPSAYHFVDWLKVAGQTYWQVLPLCPIGYGNSPYMGLSAFAGNPLLIDLMELYEQGWLAESDTTYITHNPHSVDYEHVSAFRMMMLRKAAYNFFKSSSIRRNYYDEFCEKESYWLEDYALFQALNEQYHGVQWTEWDVELRRRDPKALESARADFAYLVEFHKFTQWTFYRQFNRLREYAHSKGIKIIGDLPIFLSHHSSDVWAHQEYFKLDDDGNPLSVAGVPPDYFSETGQRWGNPLYKWDKMKEDNYSWWIKRFKKAFELYDVIRIDHFRGFESYWEIPATEETAVNGAWKKGPGKNFFKIVKQKLGDLQIIAEDLGIITQEVKRLRQELGFPGMRVLQFAFNGGVDNDYLPHRYERNTVVYTGTHDNDTTVGWYQNATEHERDFVRRYCQTDGTEIHWDLIRLALQSVADIVLIPFQDVLGLGSEARMNTPATVEGNWQWRFTWDQVHPNAANRLHELSALYERCHTSN